jgi:hypothetical protein
MGWGRMLLLGNWGQQMDIEDQQKQIAELQDEIYRVRRQGDAGDLASRVQQLEAEIDEMRLYMAALIRYLGEKGSLDKAEFGRLVDLIDREDGTADGAYRGPLGPQ